MRKRIIFIKYSVLLLIVAMISLIALNILMNRSIRQIAPITEIEFTSQCKIEQLELSEQLNEKYQQNNKAYETLAEELKKNVLHVRSLQKEKSKKHKEKIQAF